MLIFIIGQIPSIPLNKIERIICDDEYSTKV